MGELAADVVAALHLAVVALLLAGAPLSLRHPRLLPLAAATAGAVLAVNLAGADCPLTELERSLRGADAYAGGFVEHYLVRPVHPAGMTPAVDRFVALVAFVPNVVGYGLLIRRRLRAPRARLGA